MTTKQQLISEISSILERPVTETTVLEKEGGWDSLAVMVTIAAINALTDRRVSGESLYGCKTVGNVLELAGLA